MNAKDPPKQNAKAAQIRQERNRLYQRKKFAESLATYNESICWAENDSEDLGIGYANRSAVCFEMKEFEFALANIALARSHNYPERLMPKLDKREGDCHLLIGERSPQEEAKEAVLRSRLSINMEVNPKIPFLVKDVHLEERPGIGKCVIADRDFKVGDILVQDRPLMTFAAPTRQFKCCDGCSTELLWVLIPCQHCVSVMYCGEECLQKAWKKYHRFECGLTQQMYDVFERSRCSFLGPRMFFYTLGLLNDNVNAMNKFFKANWREDPNSNPFSLDYVNYNPLEELKAVYRMIYTPGATSVLHLTCTEQAAFLYANVFRQSALLRSIITTEDQMKFMQERFSDFIRTTSMLTPDVHALKFCVISSIFHDTEDEDQNREANTTIISSFAQDRVVVHQAVPKGTPLCFKEKPLFLEPSECPNCPLCSNDRDRFSRDWDRLCQVMRAESVDDLSRLNALQQLLQRHSNMASQCRFIFVLKLYQLLISNVMSKFLRAELRGKV